ncbi:hypothetical protein B1B04_12130 [Lysinibacillus sp. KCTC 33748]|nr:hypothetical protein B1B04_12130 [Lysinibacillus sp. KCTC 33748]
MEEFFGIMNQSLYILKNLRMWNIKKSIERIKENKGMSPTQYRTPHSYQLKNMTLVLQISSLLL